MKDHWRRLVAYLFPRPRVVASVRITLWGGGIFVQDEEQEQ